MKRALYSLFMFFGSVLFLAGDGTGKSFKDSVGHYSIESRKLIAAYEQVHMLARVKQTENPRNQVEVFELEYYSDRGRVKVVRKHISGDIIEGSDKLIDVATPERSFVLRQNHGEKELSLTHLPDVSNYEERREKIITVLSMVFQAPHSFFGISLPELLTRKETTVKDVRELELNGKKKIRIQTYTLPYNQGFREGADHADSWFLLDPELHMGIRQFEVKYWKKSNANQLWYELHGTIEYTEPIKDTPVLHRVDYNLLDEQGKIIANYETENISVKFGRISSEEFTLQGCGFAEDLEGKPSSWPTIFFWAVGIVVLASALIIVLRRRMTKKQQTLG